MSIQHFILPPSEWPWPTRASSCGVVSYWACAKATCIVGVSEPIKVIRCILCPPTCTRLKVTASYRKMKRGQSWIIFCYHCKQLQKKKGFIFSIKLPVCVIVTNLKLKALSVVKSWHMAVYQSLYHQWQYLLPNHCLQRPGSSTTERNVQQIKI